MPANAYDLMPFNVLVDPHEAYHGIDPEWQLNEAFDARFVLFRALFWFAFENRSLLVGFAERGSFLNVEIFVRHFLYQVGIAMTDSVFSKFIALEETIQAEISHFFNAGSIELSMRQPLTSGHHDSMPTPTKARFEATWSNQRDAFLHELTQHVHWQGKSEKQTIQINREKRHIPVRLKIIKSFFRY